MNCPYSHQSAIEEALRLNKFAFDKEIVGKFNLLIELVLKWNTTINITAHRNPTDIIYKDIIDNLYLSKFIASCVGASANTSWRTPLHIIDMGAGAGFSGMVLSIINPTPLRGAALNAVKRGCPSDLVATEGANPSIKMAFLESDRKKINFIKEVCRQLEFPSKRGPLVQSNDLHQMQRTANSPNGANPIDFIHARAESYPKEYKGTFNCSITRATWPLEEYLKYVHYYVQNGGYVFFMSGKKAKNPSRQILKDQGFAGGEEFFYKIEPESYERSILSFKKIAF